MALDPSFCTPISYLSKVYMRNKATPHAREMKVDERSYRGHIERHEFHWSVERKANAALACLSQPLNAGVLFELRPPLTAFKSRIFNYICRPRDRITALVYCFALFNCRFLIIGRLGIGIGIALRVVTICRCTRQAATEHADGDDCLCLAGITKDVA